MHWISLERLTSGLQNILEGPGGYLALYSTPTTTGHCGCKASTGKCSSSLNAQVFAAAITAGTTAWKSNANTGDTGIAHQAFVAINYLLAQYLSYTSVNGTCGNSSNCTDCCTNVCTLNPSIVGVSNPLTSQNIPTLNSTWCLGAQTPGQAFLTAFSQINHVLQGITNEANINLTAITAAVRYLDIQLCLTPVYPLSTYSGTG